MARVTEYHIEARRTPSDDWSDYEKNRLIELLEENKQ